MASTVFSIVILASQEEHYGHFTLHNTTMDDKDRCAPPTKGASTPPAIQDASESSVP